ncbi:MAG: hypothetical protein Fur0044_17460 [Anaerolineae bacterium]
MSRPLRVLFVEDSDDDMLLLVRNLRQGGFDPTYKVVQNAASMQAALDQHPWDVVISDYALPQFNGLAALDLLKQTGLDIPFIIVSGTIGEETAVAVMKAGAHDYLMKNNLTRLGPVVARELQEAEGRRNRKRAEAALSESEERFRQVISSISDWIYVTQVTEQGQLVNLYFSPQVETLTGYPYEKFMADWAFWPSVVIHPDDRAAAARQAALLAAGQSSETEYRLVRADGQIIWVRDSARVENTSATKIIYGLVSDITARKQLEEQFLQSQKMEAIGRLAGGVAHDFNNILTVMTGYTDLILSRHQQPDDSEREELEQIKKAIKQATLLTRQLLTFSRKQVVQPQVINLNTIVADLETMLRRLIGEHIELVTSLEPQLGQVKADPGQMEQVVMNLAVNARDAMPHGGTLTIATSNVNLDEAEARQHVGANPGAYVRLTISDTGHGMDAETRRRIFEPFFTTKEPGHGTGLGLATVHGIVNQSSGHIVVHSEAGEGATFDIFLPQEGLPSLAVSPVKQLPIPTEPGSETILLVEDEEAVRQLARRILLREGYTVLEAQNGEAAIQTLREHPHPLHLLLTDIVMPGRMNGQELSNLITRTHPQVKVLYMSGYTDNIPVPEGEDDPMKAFLAKPFTPGGLVRKVRELLDAPSI